MPRKSLIARITAAILMVAALSFAVAACGSDDSGSDSTPKPVAQIDPVTGVSTKVTLDAGFVEALTALKVTPGPISIIPDGKMEIRNLRIRDGK